MRRQENRVHPRLVVRLSAQYRPLKDEHNWQPGVVHDLSASGSSLLTPVRLPPELLIILRFTLPEDAAERSPIEVESLVLRAEALSSSGGNVAYRAALHFLNLFGEPYERVRRYVFERT